MTTAEKAAPTVSITEKAAHQVRKLAQAEKSDSHGLRVAVQGGGCSGLVYKLGMESQERPEDKVYEQHGVKLFIDKKSVIYLVGTELDFSDGLNGKGFVFQNPNAKTACGCGNSFST
jgi:iron-sulfur cluster assembly protein